MRRGTNEKHPLPPPGQVFGRWTVLGVDPPTPAHCRKVRCRCSCGTVRSILWLNLVYGGSTQCRKCRAVLERERYEWPIKDPRLRLAWRRRWNSMLARCYRKGERAYRFYGARGVRVCEEWRRSVHTFLRDIQKVAGWDRILDEPLEVDRIDPCGSYTLDNIRLVSHTENNGNRRDCIFVRYKGSRMCAEAFRKAAKLKMCKCSAEKLVASGIMADQIIAMDPTFARGPRVRRGECRPSP